MAGWSDVILAAQPSLLNGNFSATAGDTWRWIFVVSDNSGTVVPFTTASVTGTAKLYSAPAGASEVYPGTMTVVTANDGSVTVQAAAAATASVPAGHYYISVQLSDGSSQKINLCDGYDTSLTVVAY